MTTPAPPPGFHYATAICHNPACPNDGVPVPDLAIPDDPAAWGWQGVTCGACGAEITDITATP